MRKRDGRNLEELACLLMDAYFNQTFGTEDREERERHLKRLRRAALKLRDRAAELSGPG